MNRNKEIQYDLTLIHFNDIHGRIDSSGENIDFAKFFTFLKDLRENKKNGEVILIDSGDTIHGTLFANLSKGRSIVEIYNAIGLNYSTLGNHDFNYGYDHLKNLMNIQKYKTLATNLIDENNGIDSFEIKNINGFKICLFGIITPETYYKTSYKDINTLKIEEPQKSVEELLENLKNEKIDMFIGITHLGLDKSTKEKNRSEYLAKKFSQLDILLDGHSHTEIKEKFIVNKTVISQVGNYNRNIGIIQIKLDQDKSKNIINYKLITKDEIDVYKSDKCIEKKVTSITKDIKEKMSRIVGENRFFLNGDRDLVRTQETNLTQLITDAIHWKTKADAVLINGGSVRDSIAKGNITVEDISKSIPFGNVIITKNVKGENIKLALENGLRFYPNSFGAMAQVSGMKVYFDPEKNAFDRVKEIFINDEILKNEKYYRLAVTDFMAIGGEEYTSLINEKELEIHPTAEEILTEYIKKVGIKKREEVIPRLISIKKTF